VVATEADLDALGLIAARRRISVRFGPVEVGPALAGANISSAINKMPDADVRLDPDRLTTPPDYFGGLAIVAEERGERFPRFTGSVVSAAPAADGVTVKALGGISLAESLIGGLTARGLPNFELVYVLARSGGLRDEQLNIEGLDTLPRETFEVVAPVDGIELEDAVDFGGVRFLPPTIAARALSALDIGDEMRVDYEAGTYALALVTATRTLDAEERGLAEIDLALAWLTARLRYGLATLPDGRPLPFKRSESLAQPTRRDLVAVRGLLTTRQWLRRPATVAESRTVTLVPDGARLEADMPPLTLQDRLALLAFARATREPDPLARVHALFEAIEFYTSGVIVPKLFSKAERKALVSSLPASFNADQQERVEHLVGNLNKPPLRIQLMQALDDEAVPMTSGEVDLLWRLRELRNDVVHGRKSELPEAEDVEHATSIVARMLVYRAAKRAGPGRAVSA
jgi:hypothetical protein